MLLALMKLTWATSTLNKKLPTSEHKQFNPNQTTNTTMAPKELNFITGNKNKLAEVQAILSVTPVKLQNQALDLPELQGTIEEISIDKCNRAAEAVSFNNSEE
jgi:hypothetical protein